MSRMDPMRKVDANRKYQNDAVFKQFVDRLVKAFEERVLYPEDVALAVELATEIHNTTPLVRNEEKP